MDLVWLDNLKIVKSSCGNGLTCNSTIPNGPQFNLLVLKLMQDMRAPPKITEVIIPEEPIGEPLVSKIEDIPTVTKDELDKIINNLNHVETLKAEIDRLDQEKEQFATVPDNDDLVSEYNDDELTLIGNYSATTNNCSKCYRKLKDLVKLKEQSGKISDRCQECFDAFCLDIRRGKKAEKTAKELEKQKYYVKTREELALSMRSSLSELSLFKGRLPSHIDNEKYEQIRRAQRAGIVQINLNQ